MDVGGFAVMCIAIYCVHSSLERNGFLPRCVESIDRISVGQHESCTAVITPSSNATSAQPVG